MAVILRTISVFFDQRQPSCSTLPDPGLFISHNVLYVTSTAAGEEGIFKRLSRRFMTCCFNSARYRSPPIDRHHRPVLLVLGPKVLNHPLKFLYVRYLEPGEMPPVKTEVTRKQAICRTSRVRTDQEIAGDPDTPPTARSNGAWP
jgi:hypothetical protein